MVSIILPVFNAAKTLDRAIQSIIHQSYKEWELLAINNGSTDHSMEVLAKWAEQDNRISLLQESTRGIAHALNTGLQSVNRKYIVRMDADDWSRPDRLAKQLAYLEHNPGIDVVSCQTKFESAVPKSGGYKRFVAWQNGIVSSEEHFVQRFAESPVAHPSVMFRRKLIDEMGLYSTDRVPEDYELWLRWMAAGKKFYKIPEPLLTWCDHENRLSRTNENYSEEAFFKVKGKYLKVWLEGTVQSPKKLVVCGTSKECHQRAQWLMEAGISIDFMTDILPKKTRHIPYLELNRIVDPNVFTILSLIGKRGVWENILSHFTALGWENGKNLLRLK